MIFQSHIVGESAVEIYNSCSQSKEWLFFEEPTLTIISIETVRSYLLEFSGVYSPTISRPIHVSCEGILDGRPRLEYSSLFMMSEYRKRGFFSGFGRRRPASLYLMARLCIEWRVSGCSSPRVLLVAFTTRSVSCSPSYRRPASL